MAEPGLGWHLLAIVITHAQFKDALGAELLQPLVHILAHGVEVLIGLVAKAKYLCGQGRLRVLPSGTRRRGVSVELAQALGSPCTSHAPQATSGFRA